MSSTSRPRFPPQWEAPTGAVVVEDDDARGMSSRLSSVVPRADELAFRLFLHLLAPRLLQFLVRPVLFHEILGAPCFAGHGH